MLPFGSLPASPLSPSRRLAVGRHRRPGRAGRGTGLGRPWGRLAPTLPGLAPVWAGHEAGSLSHCPGLAPVWAGQEAGRLSHRPGLETGQGRPVGRPKQ